jgi:hypothetical protein
MAAKNSLKSRLEALMKRVEEMEAGGDLEGLLERETAELKQAVYASAIERRQQAADRADFPPSALPEV